MDLSALLADSLWNIKSLQVPKDEQERPSNHKKIIWMQTNEVVT